MDDRTKGATLIQSVARKYITRKRLKNDENVKRQRRRHFMIKEIIKSEKSYIAMLKTLCEDIHKPLRNASNKVISKQELKTLLLNVDSIYSFHAQFVLKLETSYRYFPSPPPQPLSIPEIFMDNFKVFDFTVVNKTSKEPVYKLYVDYINNYDESSDMLNTLNDRDEFVMYLEDCFFDVSEAGGITHLPSYLILPVQRIPRYVLMLDEVVKCTDKSNIEYDKYVTAAIHMKTVSEVIDNSFPKEEVASGGSSNESTPTHSRSQSPALTTNPPPSKRHSVQITPSTETHGSLKRQPSYMKATFSSMQKVSTKKQRCPQLFRSVYSHSESFLPGLNNNEPVPEAPQTFNVSRTRSSSISKIRYYNTIGPSRPRMNRSLSTVDFATPPKETAKTESTVSLNNLSPRKSIGRSNSVRHSLKQLFSSSSEPTSPSTPVEKAPPANKPRKSKSTMDLTKYFADCNDKKEEPPKSPKTTPLVSKKKTQHVK